MSDYDFEFFRGDDHVINMNITDQNNAAVDLTGWVFKLTMKTDYDDLDAAASLTVDGSALSGGGAPNGEVSITIPNADTVNLTPGIYFIDIQAEDSGLVSTVYSGTVYVKPDVTRRIG